MIGAIYLDKQGYIWVGSKDVVQRFDGSEFRSYEQAQDGYTRQDVKCILEDESGNLWFSAAGRLYLYDRQKDTFSEYKPRGLGDEKDLATYAEFIHQIIPYGKDQLLIASREGLLRVNTATHTWEIVPAIPYGIDGVYEDSQGQFWVWARYNKVYLLDSTLNKERAFVHSPTQPHSIPEQLFAVFEARDGTFWMMGSDIVYATPDDLDKTHFTSVLGDTDERFISYAIDKQGNFWAASDQGKMLYIDVLKKEVVYQQQVEQGDVRSVSNLMIDRQGGVWLGLERDGLKRSRISVPGIRQVNPVPSSFSTRLVSQLAEDTQGMIWVGTDGSGISRFNPETDRVDCHLTSENSALVSDAVVEVFTTSKGEMLVGTYPSGLHRLFPETCKLEPISALASYIVVDLYEDESGVLWFTELDGLVAFQLENIELKKFPVPEAFHRIYGLSLMRWDDFLIVTSWIDVSLFNLKTKEFLPAQWAYSQERSPMALPHEKVYMGAVDHTNTLWLGTDNGLVRYDEPLKKFDVYFKESGLPGVSIRGMLEDQGYLWLATDNGIAQFDPIKRRAVQRYTLEDGLQGHEFNRVSAFKDSKGRLYFGGYNGFNVIEPHKLNRSFSVQPGPVAITGVYASLKEQQEEEAVERSGEVRSTSYINYRIDNKISETAGDAVSLRDIRFQFAHLDYLVPENNRFRYRLIGASETWHSTSEGAVTYHDLAPGSYRFEVKGVNALGMPSENIASYVFEVPPYWYETNWFMGVLAVLGIGGIGAMYRWRVRQVQARNATLKKLVEEQTREIREKNASLEAVNSEIEEKNISLAVSYEESQAINSNLILTNQALEERSDQLRDALEKNKEILGVTVHDLKNPLGGIIGLAEMVLEDVEEGLQEGFDSAADHLPLLKEEAERMLGIIQQLLDKHRLGEEVSLKKEKMVLGDIVSAVVRWNKKQAQKKGISIQYHTEEIAIVEADAMAIQRVLDNYVSNAIKYSFPYSEVWIHVAIVGEGAEMRAKVSVKDQGPGLSDEDKQKVFGKMQRLSAKPTAGEHSTGLGLFIVKQLVEAHGGEVGVESIHGEGATFWFTLKALEYLDEDPACETDVLSELASF